MKRPILSISLLVSGREDTTEQCLDSLRPLTEQLNTELILVDTGCGESLRKKLRTYTDQIVPFTWCNDFAKARNAGLEKATGEWFLFLDDDEWFEDVGPIIDFFRSGEYREYEQAVYIARNYSRRDGSDFSDDWVSRMIRLHEDTHFEGSVHESLVPAIGKCKRIPAFVHHYGYAFETEEARRKHYERNVSILERLMREEPDNLRWWLQIVPEYIGIKDSKRLIDTAKTALDKLKDVDTSFLNQCRGTFYSAHLTGLAMENQNQELLRLCRAYSQDPRNTLAGNANLYVLGMTAADELDLPEEMADLAKNYFTALAQWQNTQQTEQEQIIAESILLVKAAFSEGSRQTMRFLYAQALAKLSRASEYPAELRAELGNFLSRQLENKGDFLILPDSYWEIGIAHILPLEETILSLPLEQWMVQVHVLEQSKNAETWKLLRDRLQALRTREDVRYLYFAIHDANAMLPEHEPEMSAGEAEALLRTYAETHLAYAKYIYTDLVFEEEMTLLPENLRAAVWIQRMLDCDRSAAAKRAEYLEKSVQTYPPIKALAHRYEKLLS